VPYLWTVTCLDYRNWTKKKDNIQAVMNEFVGSNEMDKNIHSLKTQFQGQHKMLIPRVLLFFKEISWPGFASLFLL
jgi:hypothetical protein